MNDTQVSKDLDAIKTENAYTLLALICRTHRFIEELSEMIAILDDQDFQNSVQGYGAICAGMAVEYVKFFMGIVEDDPLPDKIKDTVYQLNVLANSLSKVEAYKGVKLKNAIEELKKDLKPLLDMRVQNYE